jgi:hypothetical protein
LRYPTALLASAAVACAAAPAAGFQTVINRNASGDNSNATGSYTLSGTVVDSVTGAPIRRALVQLNGVQSRLALTDEGGKFRFENLVQCQCAISAIKPGYADRAESGKNSANTTVTIGADAAAVVLKLEPESTIAVHVTGEDGEAAEGLPVRVLGSQIQQGRRHWTRQEGGQTDEQGALRVGHLRPGKYYVSVGPSFRPVGYTGEGGAGADVGYPRTFYPNAADLEGAALVDATAGNTLRLELAMSTVPVYRISGAVVGGPLGQPCFIRVTDASGENVPIGARVNPATGVFRSGVIPAGFYTLRANCVADGDIAQVGKLPLRVNSNQSNLIVPVVPIVSIPVMFRRSGASEDGNDRNPAGMLLLTQKQLGDRVSSRTEENGDRSRLVVKGVEPGTYSVDIWPNGGWYVESARYGSVDLVTDDLTVPDGGTTENIEVTLKNDGATLSGTVRGGSGGTSATGTVLLVPGRAPRRAQVTQIMNGTFTIGDLAPGSYRVFALDRADDLEYTNPEALRDCLAKAQEVTLGPKQEARVDLELLRREK